MKIRKHIIFYLLGILAIFIFFETTFRLYFSLRFDNAEIMLNPAKILEKFYPELKREMETDMDRKDEKLEVLLLGASVLDSKWSRVEDELKEQLSEVQPCEVVIHNLASPSHTSMDSKIKFNYLRNRPYDLVLLYHGINEVRFNNCPDVVFDDNYLHVEFYGDVVPAANIAMKFTILPYVFSYLTIKGKHWLNNQELLPMLFLEDFEWLKYGDIIKTSRTFYENYKSIIQMADESGMQIVVPTFCFNPPKEGDNRAKKEEGLQRDFTTPIEIWGRKANVLKGIAAHNQMILRELKTDSNLNNLLVIDLNASMNKSEDNFRDVCHLTDKGSHQFVSALKSSILSLIHKNQACN